MLDEYFARIGLSNPDRPDLETLRRIHAAHVAAIPFENLDILLGRPILIDLDHLREKLLRHRRGGYCFEQNTLLLAVLRELGFEANAREARVMVGATTIRPRTHMVIEVRYRNEEWLADVGFGGEGLLEPVRMTGEVSMQGMLAYRVVSRDSLRVLQLQSGSDWIDQYAFEPHSVHSVDFEVANWFTSTYPGSPFVRTLTAQRATYDARHVLRYPMYSLIQGSAIAAHEIVRDELLPLLRDVFLIDLPAGTTFRVIDATDAKDLNAVSRLRPSINSGRP
jgi:N-hydroxyarylamine O-acetyltransferase